MMTEDKSTEMRASIEASNEVLAAYSMAKEVVIASGFKREIDWQGSIEFDDVGESDFLQEYAWVVLSSGMRERVIRRIFKQFSDAFYNWQSSVIIAQRSEICRENALHIFNNERKVGGIINTANFIASVGFGKFRESLKDNTVKALLSLDFIGPITCYHLAKNIGINVAKPDRHLQRIAQIFRYSDVQQLCCEVSQHTGDKISVVDLVFWRFAVIVPDYISILNGYSKPE